jgi:predicted RNase H-like nuclease (RuvC/YqgF family)
VTRETDPEVIDKLQRRKLELEVVIVGLKREKDPASKERLQEIQKAVADLEEELRPLKAAYESEQKRNREINEVRKKIEELKAKADDAERRYACNFYAYERLVQEMILEIRSCNCIRPSLLCPTRSE